MLPSIQVTPPTPNEKMTQTKSPQPSPPAKITGYGYDLVYEQQCTLMLIRQLINRDISCTHLDIRQHNEFAQLLREDDDRRASQEKAAHENEKKSMSPARKLAGTAVIEVTQQAATKRELRRLQSVQVEAEDQARQAEIRAIQEAANEALRKIQQAEQSTRVPEDAGAPRRTEEVESEALHHHHQAEKTSLSQIPQAEEGARIPDESAQQVRAEAPGQTDEEEGSRLQALGAHHLSTIQSQLTFDDALHLLLPPKAKTAYTALKAKVLKTNAKSASREEMTRIVREADAFLDDFVNRGFWQAAYGCVNPPPEWTVRKFQELDEGRRKFREGRGGEDVGAA